MLSHELNLMILKLEFRTVTCLVESVCVCVCLVVPVLPLTDTFYHMVLYLQVAHPLVKEQLLLFIYNGFLLPVLGPALHQVS